jgi:hypothetical protein
MFSATFNNISTISWQLRKQTLRENLLQISGELYYLLLYRDLAMYTMRTTVQAVSLRHINVTFNSYNN